jgi:hypothetical protein
VKHERRLSIDSVLRMKVYGGEPVGEHIAHSVWSELCRVYRLDRATPHVTTVRVDGTEVVVEVIVS